MYQLPLLEGFSDFEISKYVGAVSQKKICSVRQTSLDVTGCYRKKFMSDISTAEANSRICWVPKDQKFHAKNEFGSL